MEAITVESFQVQLPMFVIENCWMMKNCSNTFLDAYNDTDAKGKICLQKSDNYVHLLFEAAKGISLLKCTSKTWKCKIELQEKLKKTKSTRKKAKKSGLLKKMNEDCKNVVDPEKLNSKKESPSSEWTTDKIKSKSKQETKDPETTIDYDNNDVSKYQFEEIDSVDRSGETTTDAEDDSVTEILPLFNPAQADVDPNFNECLPELLVENQTTVNHISVKSLKRNKFNQNEATDSIENNREGKKWSPGGICQYCQTFYGNVSQHMLFYCTKNPDWQHVFHCSYCHFKSRSKEEISQHKQLHDLQQSFICDICSNSFVTRMRLMKHMRYVHSLGKSPIKIHTCKECNKEFRNGSHFKRHLSTHTDLKLVQCELCGKFFKNSHNMHNHQSRVHSDLIRLKKNFPYQCEKCGEGVDRLPTHRCSENQKPKTVKNRTTSTIVAEVS